MVFTHKKNTCFQEECSYIKDGISFKLLTPFVTVTSEGLFNFTKFGQFVIT